MPQPCGNRRSTALGHPLIVRLACTIGSIHHLGNQVGCPPLDSTAFQRYDQFVYRAWAARRRCSHHVLAPIAT